jgi:hypothetical protein
MIMDEVQAGTIVQWYETLEEQAIDFLKYVPLQSRNLKTWFPRLSTVIVEACGLIDSILRYISPPEVKVNGKIKKRGKLKLPDYYELYATKLKLPECKVIVLTSPPAYRIPFGIWTKTAKEKSFESPKWWITHNHLKHKRIECFIEATLETAIDALAGSLLIIATVPQLIPAVLRQGWLAIRGNPEIIMENLQTGEAESVTLETSLFAVWLGSRPLPVAIEDFRPILYGGSPKLVSFFGRL